MIKKYFNWQVKLGMVLILLSAVFYLLHYAIFRDMHHILLYFIGDVAFVFIEVLMVTVVIHEVLKQREKLVLLKKLNMVIGVFFSEVGFPLLTVFSNFNEGVLDLCDKLVISSKWSEKDFLEAQSTVKKYEFNVNSRKGDLVLLKSLLQDKKAFLLNLLANPNLLEHDSFTNLLWAVFHLTEELAHRQSLFNLPETDYKHLSNDLKRAYSLLVFEWLSYMKHLKKDYPYLFSLAVRLNPFDSKASVIIKE